MVGPRKINVFPSRYELLVMGVSLLIDFDLDFGIKRLFLV